MIYGQSDDGYKRGYIVSDPSQSITGTVYASVSNYSLGSGFVGWTADSRRNVSSIVGQL